MVYAASGFSYQNLDKFDKVLLNTYEEANYYLFEHLKNITDKVAIYFVDNGKKERYSIYYYNSKWLNLQKVKIKLKNYFKKGE